MIVSRTPQIVRQARRAAGLSQAELAERLGTAQSAIARLERPGANPTLQTLERALAACGHKLELCADPATPTVDEAQIATRLRMTPAERLAAFSASHRNIGDLVRSARPAR